MSYLAARPQMRPLLERVAGDVHSALGLPNEAYLCPEFYAAEKQKVFAQNWACAGVGADIAEPGSVAPVTLFDEPLLLVRDKQGQIKVFYNVCRHRGMILVDEAQQCNVIRCPYHSWCYNHAGDLVMTPHAGGPGNNTCERLDKEVSGLLEVRSHVFMDMIFVNLDGKAAPFEEMHRPLITRWAEFDKPLYHAGEDSRFQLELNTNWKLAVENYAESYHLPWVHPALNAYSRLEDHYNILEEGHFSGQGTLVYSPSYDASGRSFPCFNALSEKWDKAAEYITLLPNAMIGVHKDHSYVIRLEPQGPGKTTEHIDIYYAQPEALSDDYANLRARNKELWKTVFKEDIFVVEGMQRARHASGFDGGVFAPAMDAPTHLFHRWIATKMLVEETEPTV